MADLFSSPGYPRGWFLVSFSHELERGQVKPIRYFGQDLVILRTQSGAVNIHDAHCPHLGGHLGYGGEVEGEALVCPFHAWKFNGKGECVDIPYAEQIPPKARIGCWPTVERNGMIFVYHDSLGRPPEWEIPEIDGYGDDAWTDWDHESIAVKTHPHAIVENVADTGHFIPVHNTHVESYEAVFDGHTATQINSGVAYPLGGGKDRYSLRATYHGPGYQVTSMSGFLESMLVNAHTPIDEENLRLWFAVRIERTTDEQETAMFQAQYIKNLRDGFFQDIAIWEHKVFVERPVLCDGDGPVMKLRKWYSQFFERVDQDG